MTGRTFLPAATEPDVDLVALNARTTAAYTRARSATPEDFGTNVGTGGDDTAALQAAINAGIANDAPVIAAGTYKTTDVLTATSDSFTMYGISAQASVIQRTTAGDILVISSATSTGSGRAPSGVLSDLTVMGPSPRATDGATAITLNRMRRFQIDRVNVNYTDVAIDARGNCYGFGLNSVTTLPDGVNVGLMLRGSPPDNPSIAGSGSDITAVNCWLGGTKAAVWMEPFSNGYHFYGGQLAGGDQLSAEDDTLGSVVHGRSYLPTTTLAADAAVGATTVTVTDATLLYGNGHCVIDGEIIAYTGKSGNVLSGVTATTVAHAAGAAVYPGGSIVSVEFNGVSWEGTNKRHAVRGWGQALGMSFNDCSFNAAGTRRIKQVYKLARGGPYAIAFRRCYVLGTWTGTAPLDISSSPNYTQFHLEEQGTFGAPTFSGTALNLNTKPMVAYAGLARAYATFEDKVYFGGRWMRFNAAVLETSADGTTWTAV